MRLYYRDTIARKVSSKNRPRSLFGALNTNRMSVFRALADYGRLQSVWLGKGGEVGITDAA